MCDSTWRRLLNPAAAEPGPLGQLFQSAPAPAKRPSGAPAPSPEVAALMRDFGWDRVRAEQWVSKARDTQAAIAREQDRQRAAAQQSHES